MDVENIREYCLSLPKATEDLPFDETSLAFRVKGKIFAMLDLENPRWFVLKCKPEYAVALRIRYAEISGAWHMNKVHWNQVDMFGSLPDDLIHAIIRHSYAEVAKKLPKRDREANPEITSVIRQDNIGAILEE